MHLPPAVRLAEVTGTLASVEDLLAVAHLPNGADVLEPQPIPGRPDAPTRVRALIRAPLRDGNALAAALRAAQGVRTARKAPDPVRIRIDPADLD